MSSAASSRVSPQAGPGAPQTALLATRAAEMAQYTRELLAPLHARLEAQATQIGRLENEVEHLRAQLAAAAPTNGVAHEPHGQAAPPVDAEASASPPETQDDDAPRPEERARRWWPRLIAWLGGAQSP